MKKIIFLSFFILGCGGEIYYLDSYNYSQSGESTYETKELESENLEGAFTEAYEIIANEIISVYSSALNKDNNLGGVDNEIKALEFLNQALFNYEIFTVNREKMRINITDKEFERKSTIRDSILNKSRIKEEAEKSIN
tara:strand:- start:15897 stop:16310 length:414 start_codon:yes stop_codon:yes gene_type:complete